MSNTDKDTPQWAKARWYAEHTIRCNAGRDDCDLPPMPAHPEYRWRRGGPRCVWTYEDRRTYQQACHGVPHWFRDHIWTSRERTSVRDDCRRIVGEHRGGEVVTEPSVRQHRHCAAWLWY